MGKLHSSCYFLFSTASPSFVSIAFPDFVGAITGVSQSGIGISEKVWMTYDTPDLLTFVVLGPTSRPSRSNQPEPVGVGDHATHKFDLIGYKEDSAFVYDDVTMPSMTGQPYIDSIAYVDKHPQPSGEGALLDFYGHII